MRGLGQSRYILSLCRRMSAPVHFDVRETYADNCAYILLRLVANGVRGFDKTVEDQGRAPSSEQRKKPH